MQMQFLNRISFIDHVLDLIYRKEMKVGNLLVVKTLSLPSKCLGRFEELCWEDSYLCFLLLLTNINNKYKSTLR